MEDVLPEPALLSPRSREADIEGAGVDLGYEIDDRVEDAQRRNISDTQIYAELLTMVMIKAKPAAMLRRINVILAENDEIRRERLETDVESGISY